MIDKERIISMKRMSSKEIKEAIENVRASLAVENIEMDELSVIIGEKYLKGEISVSYTHL
ncbi:MAG: Uncharacterized protein CI947_2574, partial [Halanaerobium sp.]